ncbi:transformer-SR ribonucleoprotein [Grosmannia clavigera kw1407]|uniref:Transformer-SR ribonucleoprotein n=1 Tax=Grosmannia clavigera (strain kw1407 / UAMH 11150) TaxID=655863 RepID=F0XM84_GROCL|nr:transformer-SR ribonucleoprotein [Grosmannia clavigera kw1407]EFX01090.1 transformer-SR ribonucleoprotein [Grosmannia clavigera kw1407]
MASAPMDYEPTNGDRFDDDGARYERDEPRDESPRRDEGQETSRRRSASPGATGNDRPKDDNGSRNGGGGDDDGAVNPGSNLFVTGIHPRLSEEEVSRLFEKYGEVEKCQIMRDPHTKESRGFGFVKMVTSDQADAAKDGLQGEVIDGRSLSIEKARRARPRTPTPGKYFGPPKRVVRVRSAVAAVTTVSPGFGTLLRLAPVDTARAVAVTGTTLRGTTKFLVSLFDHPCGAYPLT